MKPPFCSASLESAQMLPLSSDYGAFQFPSPPSDDVPQHRSRSICRQHLLPLCPCHQARNSYVASACCCCSLVFLNLSSSPHILPGGILLATLHPLGTLDVFSLGAHTPADSNPKVNPFQQAESIRAMRASDLPRDHAMLSFAFHNPIRP